jgi:hypothetical protein
MDRNSEKIKQTETIVRIKENKGANDLRRAFIVYERSENASAKRTQNKPSTQKTDQDSN